MFFDLKGDHGDLTIEGCFLNEVLPENRAEVLI